MKSALPANHGLSQTVLSRPELVPKLSGFPSITNIQSEALAAGVARGQSVLVSAPTSTGKTLIGWWTIASAIERGQKAVYLVSHRALAKQKFEEATRLFLSDFLNDDRSEIVCATGDGVIDAAGRRTNLPLGASVLIATYEKFLAALSVGGPPRSLDNVCFVCDEVQLVGDHHRGQSVELLLTLMKRAGWAQFVGLSAVLGEGDSRAVADWLGIPLVRSPNREKGLVIECRTAMATYSVSVAPGQEGVEQEGPRKSHSSPLQLVDELIKAGRSPVIAFCMKVDETIDLASEWASRVASTEQLPPSLGVDIDTPLIEALKRRTAYHNAELTEDERLLVEERVADGLVDVVFATSTLAAGVNFPLGGAVFCSWQRWNFDKKAYVPIGTAEFQNMAGRVGRMGQAGDFGMVLLIAEGAKEIKQARALIDISVVESLGRGISPDDFGSLTLQLFAGQLCETREDAFELIGSTLTAAREKDINRSGIAHWKDRLFTNIDRLVSTGCLIELRGKISVTAFGIAVAHTGLKPETALFFLNGLRRNGLELANILSSPAASSEDDLLFILCHAALRSPEFGTAGGKPSRTINWRIGRDGPVNNDIARRLSGCLFEQPWNADASAANGALQLTHWAGGAPRASIEKAVVGVRLGSVQSLARDTAWVLTGIAEVIFAMTSPTLAEESKPAPLRGRDASAVAIRQLARTIRRQAVRLGSGLPSDVLWMTELALAGPQARMRREQVMALRRAGICKPLELMDGSEAAEEQRRVALGLRERGGLSNLIRNAARIWGRAARSHNRNLHIRRAKAQGCSEEITALYDVRGDQLETMFESALNLVSIPFERLDHGGVRGRPDYALKVEDFPAIVVEIKSRQSDSDTVSLNSATEVLSASELAGLGSSSCVTLCSPCVDPSVPRAIEAAKRLCVVDIADFCEAILRLREGTLTRSGFYNWLTTPGVALTEALPISN